MENQHLHLYHIPVMGTGFTIDTPLSVAPFGITSVISLVDDILIEQLRTYYCKKHSIGFQPIKESDPDSRANRITAYLNLLDQLIEERFEEIVALPFNQNNDKAKYFDLLPDSSDLKKAYLEYNGMKDGEDKKRMEDELNGNMKRGVIEANIMTKLDRTRYEKNGEPKENIFSDAKSALRGFAQSTISGNIVFSAGMNPTLYGYLEKFKDFYRGDNGKLKKGVVLKVNDYRSALIQGKFLAKKGIEISEFRIESSINCGGHAFVMNGQLIGPLLQEFSENKEKLPGLLHPLIRKYYENNKLPNMPSESDLSKRITYQGGLGNSGENTRILKDYGFDGVGWASPFLLVPEVSPVDKKTCKDLADSGVEGFFLSGNSPMNIPFHNFRKSTAIKEIKDKIEKGNPGSPCPKSFLISDSTYTKIPICIASREYQNKRLESLNITSTAGHGEDKDKNLVFLQKECICHNLGNSVLINYGITKLDTLPVSVCPGPNLAYFNRTYSLSEMTDYIYGRNVTLTDKWRPHFFEKELDLYVVRLEKELEECESFDSKTIQYFKTFIENLIKGIDYYQELPESTAQNGENISGLHKTIPVVREKIENFLSDLEEKSANIC